MSIKQRMGVFLVLVGAVAAVTFVMVCVELARKVDPATVQNFMWFMVGVVIATLGTLSFTVIYGRLVQKMHVDLYAPGQPAVTNKIYHQPPQQVAGPGQFAPAPYMVWNPQMQIPYQQGWQTQPPAQVQTPPPQKLGGWQTD